MFDYCEICKNKTENCNYDPISFLAALNECLDNFEWDNLNCPADFLVLSDVHEDFMRLRFTIDRLMLEYCKDVKN